MKHILWIALALSSAFAMVACSKGSSNNNNIGVTCPAGATYNGAGCIDAYGNLVGTTAYPVNLGYFADNWSSQRTVTVLDRTAFSEFLRTTMGVCDRLQVSGGTADCDSWVNGGFDIVMMVPDPTSNNINITFRAWPQTYYNSYYSLSTPNLSGFLSGLFGGGYYQNAGGYFDPMNLPQWTVSVVANSQGFEARTYGPLYSEGNRSLIQVRVEQGKLGDGSFTFQIGYPNCVADSAHKCSSPVGTWFAQGTFTRCQSANCAGGLW